MRSEGRGELIASHIHSNNSGGAPLQQHLCEAASARSDIQTPLARRIDTESVQPLHEFQGRPTDIRVGRLGEDLRAFRDGLGGFHEDDIVHGHLARRNGGLRPGPGVKIAVLNKVFVCAHRVLAFRRLLLSMPG